MNQNKRDNTISSLFRIPNMKRVDSSKNRVSGRRIFLEN